jgi:glycosyltransferase involved in cell wall biosynthesis
MSGPLFTILLPSTGEKAGVIVHAMDCVLNQTIQDTELFIVGDGMGAGTREVVERYAREDPRIRLFEFPKQRSRGTPNRHRLLMSEARGELVCYLCDRDLWSPDHLQRMADTLAHNDIAYTQSLMIRRDDIEFGPPLLTLARHDHRAFFLSRIRHTHEFLPLSGVGHSMAFYRELPHGWRANSGMATDYFMWLQFLEIPHCRVGMTLTPTLLWFPTSSWGADASDEKVAALGAWYRRIMSDEWLAERWRIAFEKLYVRGSVFRVRAAIAENELGWPEP